MQKEQLPQLKEFVESLPVLETLIVPNEGHSGRWDVQCLKIRRLALKESQ